MRDHRNLLAWQLAKAFSTEVHHITVKRWTPIAKVAFDQLRRASLSVRINIVEGYGRGTPRQTAHFLTISYASTLEATDLLEFCHETSLLSDEEVDSLLAKANRVQALILALKRKWALTPE